MSDLAHELAEFTAFAQAKLSAGVPLSIDDVFDEWRLRQVASEDDLAIAESLADLAAGERGRPFEAFAAEFERRHDLHGKLP